MILLKAEEPNHQHVLFAYDDERHIQTLERLIALCPACHEVKHIGLAAMRGRRGAALAHLATVNGWSLPDAELYLEGSFEVWHRRSCHEWQLDLLYLKQFDVSAEAIEPNCS